MKCLVLIQGWYINKTERKLIIKKNGKVETVSKRSAVTHVLQTKSQVDASEFSVNHATDNITNGFRERLGTWVSIDNYRLIFWSPT